MFKLFKSLARLVCNHDELDFIRNLYDNEFWQGRLFQCRNCNKFIHKDVSGKVMDAPVNSLKNVRPSK